MNKKTQAAIAAVLLAGGASAQAQVSPVRPQYEFPSAPVAGAGAQNVQIGGTPFFFGPFVSASVGMNDNLFLSNENPKRSWFVTLNPGFTIDARDPNKAFIVQYLGSLGRFIQSRGDDYVDHSVRASFDMLVTRQAAFRLGYEHVRGHDPRGSTDRPLSGGPDVYELRTPGVTVSFGQKGAQGRIEGYFSDARKRYQNNREITIGSDRDIAEGGVAGYFRVMPRTSVLAEFRKTEIEYSLPGSPLSGEEERYYGGVTWEATAATTGTIKAGRLRKTFDNGAPGFSGSGWEAAVSWSPRTYSKFDFYTSRQPVESSGLGNFILSEVSGAVWTHAWTSVLSTEASVKFQKDKYQGFPRTDDVTGLGLKAGFKVRPWMTLGAEYQYTNRDSTQRAFEYDRNLWMLTATATM